MHMAKALDPRHQPRVDALERKAHRLLHKIDRLNANLGVGLNELKVLTNDPVFAEMERTTSRVNQEFRGPIQ